MFERDVRNTHQEQYDRCQKAVKLILEEIDESSWVVRACVLDLREIMQDLERVRGLLVESW